MSNVKFCLARRNAEMPAFLRVLKAMPEAKLDYRPHERSRTAAELSTLIAEEDAALVSLLDTGSVTWADPAPLKSVSAIVAAFEKNAKAVNDRLEKLDDAGFEKKVKFIFGPEAVWEDTLSNMVWGFLFDAVHHRGQLSVYLRPMGGKVPAIYGPSADDSGGGG